MSHFGNPDADCVALGDLYVNIEGQHAAGLSYKAPTRKRRDQTRKSSELKCDFILQSLPEGF